MSKFRFAKTSTSAAVAAMLLGACSTSKVSQATAPTSAAASSTSTSTGVSASSAPASSVKVTIAGGDYLGGAPAYIASAKSMWASNGLQAHVANFATGVLALNALLGGQANFAFVADLPIATALLNKRGLVIDANLSKFSQWLLLTTKSSGVNSFASLKGKKIGVPVGTNAEYVLDQMLVSVGLSLSSITVVNLAPAQIVPAIQRGDIAAGVTFPTFYTVAQTILGSSYQELTYSGYAEHTVLLSAPGTPAGTVERVLRTLISADKYIASNPAAAASAIAAQSGGADSVSFVSSYLPKYAQKVDLLSGLPALLVAEGQWLNSTQGVGGSLNQATVVSATDSAALSTVDSTRVSLP